MTENELRWQAWARAWVKALVAECEAHRLLVEAQKGEER